MLVEIEIVQRNGFLVKFQLTCAAYQLIAVFSGENGAGETGTVLFFRSGSSDAHAALSDLKKMLGFLIETAKQSEKTNATFFFAYHFFGGWMTLNLF